MAEGVAVSVGSGVSVGMEVVVAVGRRVSVGAGVADGIGRSVGTNVGKAVTAACKGVASARSLIPLAPSLQAFNMSRLKDKKTHSPIPTLLLKQMVVFPNRFFPNQAASARIIPRATAKDTIKSLRRKPH